MQYLFLLYSDEANTPEPPTDPKELEAYMAPWAEYSEMLVKAGAMRGGEALEPSSTATTVSTMGGKESVTDGPFAETKEQLGGYYVVECANLDEALALAKKCPGATFGHVEVRPIMKFD